MDPLETNDTPSDTSFEARTGLRKLSGAASGLGMLASTLAGVSTVQSIQHNSYALMVYIIALAFNLGTARMFQVVAKREKAVAWWGWHQRRKHAWFQAGFFLALAVGVTIMYSFVA
ncbi:MAG TPA: hypothetical protein VLF91_03665 [Candidatus Saccharimonadales bacterium]|nr:hypothetical protein [Candidatus Saccharimonadales bacterium]